MIAATAIASIATFLVVLRLCGVIGVSAAAVATARNAMAAMRDPALDDAARETAVRSASLSLMRAFLSIALRGGAALLASLAPVWLAAEAGLVTFDEVLRFLARWDVIAIASAAIVAGYLLWMRLWPSR